MQGLDLRTVEAATEGKILRGRPGLKLTGISTDTRTLKPGELFFALQGERFDAHDFLPKAAELKAGAAIVHKKDAAEQVPGLPIVLVQDTTRALGDLALWHRRQCTTTTVIGITGSNGKTTVKEMLFHILNGVVRSVRSISSFNNAVGVPLTLFQMRPPDIYAVVEMGSNSPGEIARLCEIADPDVGLITNVAPTHLLGLGSVEGVAREKAPMLKHTARRGGAFYNADDYWSRQIAKSLKGSLCSFGIDNEADLRAFNLRSDMRGVGFKVMGGPRVHIPVPGAHNAMNALAAIAVARKLGFDWNTIAEQLATFELPPQRMQIRTTRGVTLIDDAYNANPVSVEAAANTLSRMECRGRKILVLADMLELGDKSVEFHRELGETIAGFGFDYLLGYGPNTAELLASAGKHGVDEHDLLPAESKEELADALLGLLEPGDTVLLKGSRGMHLEEVIALLEKGLGVADKAAPEAPAYEPYGSAEEREEKAGVRGSSPAGRTVG